MWKNPCCRVAAAAAAASRTHPRIQIRAPPRCCWPSRSQPPSRNLSTGGRGGGSSSGGGGGSSSRKNRQQRPRWPIRKLPAVTSRKYNKQKLLMAHYINSTVPALADISVSSVELESHRPAQEAVSGVARWGKMAPSKTQLRRVFAKAAVPMIGFGFMDQTVMLQAGNLIDCSIGVTFGLSTLTAAAFGQVCSDACGVLCGGTLDRLSTMAGLPSAGLTSAQAALPEVQKARWSGSLAGVIFGCCLGLINLLFIDTSRSSSLKLHAFDDEKDLEFSVEASNAVQEGVTALTVRGPDIDGLLASATAALAVRGCSLVELHAKRSLTNLHNLDAPLIREDTQIEDVFYVIERGTGLPFPDDKLEELAKALLNSTRKPLNALSVKAASYESATGAQKHVKDRVHQLEKEMMYRKHITVIPSSSK